MGDTVADDGTSKSLTGGQKDRGAASKGGKPGHTRSPQATAGGIFDSSSAGGRSGPLLPQQHQTQAVVVPGQTVLSCPWLTQDFLPNFLGGLSTRCKDHLSSGRGLIFSGAK